MNSKAIIILWIVTTTLPNFLHATAEEDEANIILYKQLFDQNNFTRKVQYGKEFVHPTDPTRIVRIQKYNTETEKDLVGKAKYEQLALQTLINKANELGNIHPLTPYLYRVLNFQFDQTSGGLSFETERYRGNLIDGINNDEVLRARLLNFSARLDMYKQLAFIFQQMSALSIKHCNIEISRVLYKKTGDDFSSTPLQETDTDFIFVLTDFMYVKDLSSRCTAGIVATWDQEDAQGNIPMSGKCKGKIEIFGLAMMILRIETFLIMVKQDGTFLKKVQNIKDALSTMPDAPDYIEKTFYSKKAILATQSFDILSKILVWVSNAIADPETLLDADFILTGVDLLPYLAYVEQANALIFEQREIEKYPALKEIYKVKDKVVGNYAAFNALLQSMLQPNDYVNGRPDAAFVGNALTQIQQEYVANIQSLSRDRVLLV